MYTWLERSYNLRPLIALLLGATSLALLLYAWQSPKTEIAAWPLGFHYPEEQTSEFRAFSKNQSLYFVQDLAATSQHLRVAVSSPAPLPARALTISYNQKPIAQVEIGPQQRQLHLLLPSREQVASDGFLISFSSETVQLANDNRGLGLLFGDFQLSKLQVGQGPLSPLPLVTGLLCAAASIALWRSRFLLPIQASTLCFGLFALVWAIVMIYAAIQRYQIFQATTYDLGIYDQNMWLISRGYPPFNTGMGIHLLGNHGALILYPFALLYLIAPHVWTLLIAQVVLVVAGAIAIFLIGRTHQHAWLGGLIAMLYLLHPSSQNLVLFDFHPDSIGATALLFALWAADQKRWRTMLFCCVVLMTCKENFALTSCMLGIWLLLQRQWRYGALLVISSLVWFVIATQLLLPSFNNQGHSIHLIERYGQYGDSMGAIVNFFLSNPLLLAELLLNQANLNYLLLLVAPFGLLCILRPHFLLIAMPALLLNLLSGMNEQRSLYYHYHALIVAVLAIASLYGLIWLSRQRQTQSFLPLAGLVCGCGLLICCAVSELRLVDLQKGLEWQSARLHYYDYALSFIPNDANIAADMQLQPHLTHRQQAFLFPNPFQQVTYFDPVGQPFKERTDYILYDLKRTNDLFADSRDKADLLDELETRGLFRAVMQIDGVLLLQRNELALPDSCFGRDWQASQCLGQP